MRRTGNSADDDIEERKEKRVRGSTTRSGDHVLLFLSKKITFYLWQNDVYNIKQDVLHVKVFSSTSKSANIIIDLFNLDLFTVNLTETNYIQVFCLLSKYLYLNNSDIFQVKHYELNTCAR